METLKLDGKLPSGALAHFAGPMEGGWRVVGLWESQEALDTFTRERLGPALQVNGVPEPKVTMMNVHNFITSSN